MKRIFLACILAFVLAPLGFSAPTLALTTDIAAGFSQMPTLEAAFQNLTENPNPLWGLGWEITIRRIGLGGTYLVNFTRDQLMRWTLDWYGEGIYMSYHLFGGGSFIDPFVQAGIGCAGRVALDPHSYSDLAIELFPVVSGGVALNLGGLSVGAKASYVPFSTPVPATWIPGYPVDPFQVAFFAGFILGR
jgi:hypothetical protein